MTLGPPTWATGSWATNAWSDGSWVIASGVFIVAWTLNSNRTLGPDIQP